MVGISYLGGISREATTMLGLVVSDPVLVIVDRLSNDNHFVREQVGLHDGILVSRKVVNELVFYEISKLEKPMFIDYFSQTE